MTGMEAQLRAILTDRVPETVDTTGWADAARARARRTRARTSIALSLVTALVITIAAATLLGHGGHRSTMPAHPRVPDRAQVYATLCAANPAESGPLAGDVQPSLRYSAAALCPIAPSDPAWSNLPAPALLAGTYLDRLADGSGPPVENCELGKPRLPGFRLVARNRHGGTTEIHPAGERCAGAQLVQSFADGLAQQQYDATHPASGCAALDPTDSVQPPRHLPDPTSVHICVTADPYVEAEPAPVRYRPVREVELPASQWTPLLTGIDQSSATTGKYVDCPWRHVTVKIVTTNDTGARLATVLVCQQDLTTGDVEGAQRLSTMRGAWPVLPRSAQALVQQQVSAYLNARAG